MTANIEKVKSVVNNQLTEINKLTGINSLLLSVCLVDTLAGFYSGYNGQPSGNKVRFEKFADKYLNKHKPTLYEVRCNLTHSFSNTLTKFLFVDNKDFTSTFPDSIKIFGETIFNIDSFKIDLASAIDSYFNDLENVANELIRNNFNIRFENCNILSDHVLPTVRNLDGKMIKNYADLDDITGLNLKIALFDPTQIKK